MDVKQRLFAPLIGLAIVGGLGAIAHYAFGMNFWVAALILGLAMVANGLFAEWEDRQPGGFFNPDGKDNDA